MAESIKKIIKLIAIYARVSTGRQEEEKTIKTQLAAIREFAEKDGYTIVQEYIDDGWSGDILARPALDRLREDVKKKIWEAVLIYDPDRLARRYSYQELVMDELKEAGIEILFVTTSSPKTGEEKILHGVKGLFAEYERVKITERFRLGKLRKAKEGHIIASEAPYGYTYIPKQEGKQGYYKINDKEARVVKKIFSWVADEGLTIRAVVRRLQELDIKPRKSKRGVWSTSTLGSLLRNRTYIGEARYASSYAVIPEKPLKNERYKKIRKTSRKIKPESEWIIITVPAIAIIDRDLFVRANEQLKINFAMSKRNKKNQYLLAGLIYCPCGLRRAGEGAQHGKHIYYRCTDRVHSFPLPPKCAEKGVNAHIADKIVWVKIKELMSSPELLKKQIARWSQKQRNKVEASGVDIESIKKQISGLKGEEDRYARAFGANLITIEKLGEYTKDVRDKIRSLEKQLVKAEEVKVQNKSLSLPETEKEISAFAEQARITLNDLKFELKRAIVMNVIEKVVSTQKELNVYGYIPVDPSDYVSFCSIHRHRGATERREVHVIQSPHEAAGARGELPVRHD